VNVSEAKSILMTSRPGTADMDDPQVAEALALAKSDAELERWLEAQQKVQAALRAKFGEIKPPAGLKEQIISEHAAGKRMAASPQKIWFALAACAVLIGALAIVWYPRPVPDDTLAVFQANMVRTALGPYGMDVVTNDLTAIRGYLAQNHAPADLKLPASLQHATVIGCAAREWAGARVSLICYRTGRPLPLGENNDLWLFIVDRKAVKDAEKVAATQIAKVNRLATATWTDGDNLYFLGIDGGNEDLQKFL